MRGRLMQIRQKYAPALDVDDYVSKEKEELAKRQEETVLNIDNHISAENKKLAKRQEEENDKISKSYQNLLKSMMKLAKLKIFAQTLKKISIK